MALQKKNKGEFKQITKGKRGNGVKNQSLFNENEKGSKVKQLTRDEIKKLGYNVV